MAVADSTRGLGEWGVLQGRLALWWCRSTAAVGRKPCSAGASAGHVLHKCTGKLRQGTPLSVCTAAG